MANNIVKSRAQRSDYLPFILDDSDTFTIQRLVTLNSDGHLDHITNSDEKILGVLTGFRDKNGKTIDFDSGSDVAFTAASDNTTDAEVSGIVDVGRNIWIQLDADASLATTNLGQYFDMNNSIQVDVADASDSNGAVQLIKLDPEGDQGTADASMGLYRIADHQFGHLDS
jgi:hypothetical protein